MAEIRPLHLQSFPACSCCGNGIPANDAPTTQTDHSVMNDSFGCGFNFQCYV